MDDKVTIGYFGAKFDCMQFMWFIASFWYIGPLNWCK